MAQNQFTTNIVFEALTAQTLKAQIFSNLWTKLINSSFPRRYLVPISSGPRPKVVLVRTRC